MVNFSVSVWSDFFNDLPVEESIENYIAEGFSCTELSINHSNLLLQRDGTPEVIGNKLAEYAKNRGFRIPQGHLDYRKGLCSQEAVDCLKREIDLFLAIGIKNAIIHVNGGGKLPEEERFQLRCRSLAALTDHVKGTDLKLCIENLGSVPETHTVERIRKIMDAVNSENLGICLDTGHLHLVNGRGEATQTQSEFILGAGNDLCAMHVTNNSGVSDVHLMPFSSRYGVDWKDVLKALRAVDYKGLFNLEILGENKAPMYIRKEKLKFIKKMVDYMISDEFLTE